MIVSLKTGHKQGAKVGFGYD